MYKTDNNSDYIDALNFERKKLLLFLSIILLFCFSLITPTLSYGLNTIKGKNSTYYTHLSENEINDIMELKLKDIPSALSWIKQRNTYVVVEESKKTGIYTYWWNTPNIQQIVYNEGTNKVLSSGYFGSGINPRTNYLKSPFKMVKIPKSNEAKTGLQKYGFHIPSPTYIGEYPRITMSIAGVLVEDNPVKFVITKVGAFVFGGSIVKAPDKSDLNSLKYLSPSDYNKDNVSFENWLSLYWGKIIKKMPKGQILLSTANKKGEDSEGNSWVRENVLDNTGISSMKDPSEINNKLKEVCGPNYQDVVSNIIAYGVNEKISEDFSKTPERIMPYSLDDLSDSDRSLLKIADPRSEYQDKIGFLGATFNVGILKMITVPFSAGLLNLAGSLSELTVFLNSTTTFDFIENLGVNPIKLWKMPFISSLITIGLIIFVVYLLINIIKLLLGKKSIISIFANAIVAILILSFVLFLNTAPRQFYNGVKTIGSSFFNMGSYSLQMSGPWKDLISQGNKSENADATYWLPYYSLWSNYNTGAQLTSDEINKANLNKEPEQNNMVYPTINGKEIKLWSANLADSFTQGSSIDGKAYRTVDHYMAPRITFNKNNADMITVKQNENYNGGIQKFIDIGSFLFILLILLCVIVKVLLFIEVIYEVIMLPITLTMSTMNKRDLSNMLKRFFFSFVRVGLWDLVTCFIIFISLMTTGIASILMAVCCSAMVYKIMTLVIETNSIVTPRFLLSTKKFMNKHNI